MKLKNNLDFCDFCEVTNENVKNRISIEKCVICGKHVCSLNKSCRGIAADYGTTSHFPRFISFPLICKSCFNEARRSRPEKIKAGVDLKACGSFWAIKLGEYVHKVKRENDKKTADAYVEEIKRLIKMKK